MRDTACLTTFVDDADVADADVADADADHVNDVDDDDNEELYKFTLKKGKETLN